MSEKVTHIGLTLISHDELEKFSQRVEKFNVTHGGERVKLTAMWTERKVPHCIVPHYDILLEYENKDIADKFWLT